MFEPDDRTLDWITAHLREDPLRLSLSCHGDPLLHQAIIQIDCRQRASRKIPTFLTNRRFIFADRLSAEQCTSESIAGMHVSFFGPVDGLRVLDLTAGLGIDTFSMAAAGAFVTAVEIDPDKADVLRHNSAILGLSDRVTVVCDDARHFVSNLEPDCMGLIFIDPARRDADGSGRRLYGLSDTLPDPVALMSAMLRVSPRVIVKASPMVDVTEAAAQLGASDICLFGNTTECKELTALVCRDRHTVTVHAIVDNFDIISSPLDMCGRPCGIAVQPPLTGMILVEPFAAVMKAAPWLTFCSRYNLNPIHPGTHLFVTSDESIVNSRIPAHLWRIEQAVESNNKSMRDIRSAWPKANVSARNFVLTSDQLAKRMNIAPGGDTRIIGCKAMTSKGQTAGTLIVGRPLL